METLRSLDEHLKSRASPLIITFCMLRDRQFQTCCVNIAHSGNSYKLYRKDSFARQSSS